MAGYVAKGAAVALLAVLLVYEFLQLWHAAGLITYIFQRPFWEYLSAAAHLGLFCTYLSLLARPRFRVEKQLLLLPCLTLVAVLLAYWQTRLMDTFLFIMDCVVPTYIIYSLTTEAKTSSLSPYAPYMYRPTDPCRKVSTNALGVALLSLVSLQLAFKIILSFVMATTFGMHPRLSSTYLWTHLAYCSVLLASYGLLLTCPLFFAARSRIHLLPLTLATLVAFSVSTARLVEGDFFVNDGLFALLILCSLLDPKLPLARHILPYTAISCYEPVKQGPRASC